MGKTQRFTIALQFSALIDITPTMQLLALIEEVIPSDVLGPGPTRFLREKLEARLEVVGEVEAKLLAGELGYSRREIEEFIFIKLGTLQGMYAEP